MRIHIIMSSSLATCVRHATCVPARMADTLQIKELSRPRTRKSAQSARKCARICTNTHKNALFGLWSPALGTWKPDSASADRRLHHLLRSVDRLGGPNLCSLASYQNTLFGGSSAPTSFGCGNQAPKHARARMALQARTSEDNRKNFGAVSSIFNMAK